jgi:hypothetical protein
MGNYQNNITEFVIHTQCGGKKNKKQKQRPQLCKLKRAEYDQKTKQTLLLSGLPMIHYIFIQL